MSTPGELLEALSRQARARLPNGGEERPRTYRGRSVEDLIPVIQRELGAEAIVVRRREGLTGGVLGFFQHPFVEIEAMRGTPRVDVYDEQEPATPAPVQPTVQPPLAAAVPAVQPPPVQSLQPPPAQPLAATPSTPAPPSSASRAPAPSPAPWTPAPAPAPAFEQPSAPAPAAPAPSPAPTLPPRPALGYRVAALAPQPAPAKPPPAPAPPPAAESGSAYVTAHLAALARGDRARPRRREPLYSTPAPVPPPVGQRPPAGERPSVDERPQAVEPPTASERQPSGELPREPHTWSSDYQELAPSDVPELFPPPPAPASRPGGSERRVVAPGSNTRARTGVSRSLQRYGISEQLAEELIDGASAHALALAPRSGMAHAVRATLAQRIPVAPPLPAKGAAIVVVGAGGAGKTTCCVALLGAYRKSSSLPASFATIARGGEREELRMILSPYIMKPTPAGTPRALRALRKARSEGLAVLDTPNLSPSDRAGIRELAGVLAELKPERVVVALPATLGPTAAAQLLQAMRPLGANSLAVTHADETDQIGVAVEAACRFALAPEYMLDRGRSGGWRLSRVDPAGLAARLLA